MKEVKSVVSLLHKGNRARFCIAELSQNSSMPFAVIVKSLLKIISSLTVAWIFSRAFKQGFLRGGGRDMSRQLPSACIFPNCLFPGVKFQSNKLSPWSHPQIMSSTTVQPVHWRTGRESKRQLQQQLYLHTCSGDCLWQRRITATCCYMSDVEEFSGLWLGCTGMFPWAEVFLHVEHEYLTSPLTAALSFPCKSVLFKPPSFSNLPPNAEPFPPSWDVSPDMELSR